MRTVLIVGVWHIEWGETVDVAMDAADVEEQLAVLVRVTEDVDEREDGKDERTLCEELRCCL